MDFANYWYSSGAANPESDPGDPIGESLRLRGSNTSLTRSVNTLGNRRTFTLSTWLKRSSFDSSQQIWSQTQSGAAVFDMYFDSDSRIQVYQFNSSSYQINCTTAARYRDPSAWYHIVLRVDTTRPVPTDRVRVYANGELQPFESYTLPNQNEETYVNQANGQDMAMGMINTSVAGDGQPFDGYYAQTYYVDGQSLGPEEFGRLNAIGVWVPVTYTGTYGVNGYRFDYDGTDWQGSLLKDKSGNGNDFTYSGVGLNIAVADYDISKDTPTENYATLNPLSNVPWGPNGSRVDAIYEGGALRARNTGSNPSATISTSFIPNKIYFEVGPTTNANNRNYPGFMGFDINHNFTQTEAHEFNVLNTGQLRIPGQSTVTVFDPWFQNDIARVMWDGDTRILQVAINGGAFKSADLSSNVPAGTPIGFGLQVFNNDGTGCINFGSKAFQYEVPAGYNDSSYKNGDECIFNNGREHFRPLLGPGTSGVTPGPGQRAGDWSKYLTTNNTDGRFQTAPYFAFNGQTVDTCMSGNTNGLLTWAPTTDVNFSGNLEVICAAGLTTPNYIAAWNGNQVNYVNNSWVTVATGGGTINASQPLTIQADPNDQAALGAIRLDGEILVDFGLTGPWTSGVTAKTGAINMVGGGPSRLFNGLLHGANGSYFAMKGTNDVMRFVPPEEIIINEKLVVYPYTGHIFTYTYSIDGVEYTTEISTTGQYGTPYLITTQTGKLDYLEISGYYATTLGLEVDGQLLIDTSILSQAQEEFPTGLYWIKDRTLGSTQHDFVDTVRGVTNSLQCPNASAETSYNPSSNDVVAWCWRAGETTESNTKGSIPSQVSANQDAGFSIVTYTGTNTAGTIGHGLTQPLDAIIVKSRSAGNWRVYHRSAGANRYLALNSNGAGVNNNNIWQNTHPTNEVFSVGAGEVVNEAANYVAYCWHSVPGYSSFGEYAATGNNKGPFIHCGFKPAFVMCKRNESSANWIIYDTARNTYNPAQYWLYASSVQAEGNAIRIDITANGFKPRDVSDPINRSSRYIYFAFAENPFTGKNTVPPTAV